MYCGIKYCCVVAVILWMGGCFEMGGQDLSYSEDSTEAFDAVGNLVFYTHNDHQGNPFETVHLEYDSNNNIIKKTLIREATGRVAWVLLYSYNDNNQLLNKKWKVKEDSEVYSFEEYEYDLNGNTIARRLYDFPDTMRELETWLYEDGNLRYHCIEYFD